MFVTDRRLCAPRPVADVVAGGVAGGVNLVQLREKDLPAGDLLLLARQLRGLCGRQALLLVNDRADVALLSGADGVHLGEQGLPTAAVRKWLPPSLLVGRSVHSVSAARQAEADGADYLVVGPIFATRSHPGRSPAGVGLLQAVTARVKIPVIAIGGIGPGEVSGCLAAGAMGVAALSALGAAADPAAAARAFSEAISECD